MEEEQPGKEYLPMHVHKVQLYVPCYCEFGFGYLVENKCQQHNDHNFLPTQGVIRRRLR